MEPRIADRRGWLIVALTAFVAINLGIALTDIISGVWNHDSGLFLLHASYAADGLKPYIDYETIYTPLLDAIDAIPMALGIDRLALAVLLPISWIAANSFASALVVYSWSEDMASALAAAAIFPIFSIQNDGNHLTLEYGVAFFSSIALAAAAPRFATRRWAPFVAGSAVALAALSKQNGALTALPVAVAIIFIGLRRLQRDLVLFLAGAAAPVVVIAAWLRFDFRAIKRNLFDIFVTDYASKSVLHFTAWTRDFVERPMTILFFILALVASLVIVSGRRATGEKLFAASLAICVALQYAPRLARDYEHYDINVWPTALLACTLVLAGSSAATRRAAAVALMLFLSLSLAYFMSPGASQRWHEEGDLFSLFYPTAQALERSTPLFTKVRQYGAEPIIEYLAYRTPEVLTTPYAKVPRINDGRNLYDDRPPANNAVVIIDRGQPWVTDMRRRVEARGFVVVYRSVIRTRTRFVSAEILLHRDFMKRNLQS